ncbi:urease accessory UreF family protein [Labrys neptuniae]|uniref:urease accessory protein UreF n=1 Tax=Labrys neptuniae TaxID=376174 RepID=UPI002891F043|nr:urease accessory UreF family protein [Labrys neptuniae]MDT3379745.1 urease accessory UreF family protein [Labrys neptuniae]
MSTLDPSPLLVALQHADSQFPSGGFAFSQGLEASALLKETLGGWDLADFILTQLGHRWAGADRVALIRAHRCGSELAGVAELDREVEASTFVDGLRAGSRRNGMALLTTHACIGTPKASDYRALVREGSACGHLAVMQGLLWRSVGLDETAAASIGGYQAAASLATAAIRLGLIGAIEAQAILTAALPVIAGICREPVADDEPIRSFNPLTEIAVSFHRGGGQRLFSN